jgi:hypothetical protein
MRRKEGSCRDCNHVDYAAIRRVLRSLKRDLIGGRLGCAVGFAVCSGTVECPDSIRFELDDELLNDMLDRFALAVRNFEETIVLAGGQFPLHEDVSAFRKPVGQLREAFAERDHVVPLRPFLPLLVLVLPGLLRCDGELRDGRAVRQVLGFGVLADETIMAGCPGHHRA